MESHEDCQSCGGTNDCDGCDGTGKCGAEGHEINPDECCAGTDLCSDCDGDGRCKAEQESVLREFEISVNWWQMWEEWGERVEQRHRVRAEDGDKARELVEGLINSVDGEERSLQLVDEMVVDKEERLLLPDWEQRIISQEIRRASGAEEVWMRAAKRKEVFGPIVF